MPDTSGPSRPLLHPVLELKITPVQKEAPSRGKKESHIKKERLEAQREALAAQIAAIRAGRSARRFGEHMLLVAEMFADSFAPSKAPRDLFKGFTGSLLRQGTRDGYLLEVHQDELTRIERRIKTGMSAPIRCDISRVKRIRAYGAADIYRDRTLVDLWEDAARLERGRGFHVWLFPFLDTGARAALLTSVREMEGRNLIQPTLPQMLIGPADGTALSVPDSSDRQTSLAILQRQYLEIGHGRALVQIASPATLNTIIESGGVFRIEPVRGISLTAPGEGEEPGVLPRDIGMQPIVGIVDGGCNARRYQAAEAWRDHTFVDSAHADVKHGNQVASVIIHGHEWNNNLPLPELYCRVGIAQAIARPATRKKYQTDQLVSYINRVVERHPDTRVWNLSWNESCAADRDYVSAIGHDLAQLSRKYNVLFVISAGNVSNTDGNCIAPPADCEAALVVGGRSLGLDGRPGPACVETLPGYGPELQLVPQVTSYSPLRLLGGGVRRGTSFATGLISSLAAHTFDHLRDPTADMVRALIINQGDLPKYDRHLGWGTPSPEYMPWACPPGSVTLAFRRNLKPGVLYHWSGIPIPREMMRGDKMHGRVSLVTVHRPLCNSDGGPNYIASRVAAAVQYPTASGEFSRLVGAKEEETTPEFTARKEEYKWQPVRRDCVDFTSRGRKVGGNQFQIYARSFARNIEQYGYRVNGDIPPIETVFVVTFSDGSNSPSVYNSMTSTLGNFVESAVIDQDIEINT